MVEDALYEAARYESAGDYRTEERCGSSGFVPLGKVAMQSQLFRSRNNDRESIMNGPARYENAFERSANPNGASGMLNAVNCAAPRLEPIIRI
jgi:hypothetical protein